MNGTPVAPGFVMDITIGDATELPQFVKPRILDDDPIAQHVVEDVIAAIGKAAAAYLAATPGADAYAIRVTAIPVKVETT